MTTAVANPYLSGNFAPVKAEITVDDLRVLGELPDDLNGMFVRNGPNPQFPPIGRYHWFDGDGMLHGVQISNGKASYRNRYVQTRGFKLEQQAGKALWTGLLEPPQQDVPHSFPKNTANTSLIWHADRLLTLWEGGEPHALQLPSMATVGPYTYGGKLASAFTAHPKVDAVTGEMMFFGYSLTQPPYLQYSVVSAQGELLRTLPIELPVGVMMHDFAITENYTIFMDLPLTFRMERLEKGEPAFLFESDRPSRFGILPRHGDNSSIRWFEAPACYIFHTMNAYEVGEEVVLVACRMNATTVLDASTPPLDRESDAHIQADIPRLHRWRFNLSTGVMQSEPLDDRSCEFPRVNDEWLGRQTQYGYAARLAPDSVPRFDALIKYDLTTGCSQVHEFPVGCYGGEAVFVPRQSRGERRSYPANEDDGWLVTFVHNEGQGTSELVVVSAQDMTAEPIARILIPQRVPYGFHGTWIANAG